MEKKSRKLTTEVSARCQLMLLSMELGNRSIVFSKASLDSLLISTHLTDLKMLRLKILVDEMNETSKQSEQHMNTSFLHFLAEASDNPMTPAPAYRSVTDAPTGTYLCSF